MSKFDIMKTFSLVLTGIEIRKYLLVVLFYAYQKGVKGAKSCRRHSI